MNRVPRLVTPARQVKKLLLRVTLAASAALSFCCLQRVHDLTAREAEQSAPAPRISKAASDSCDAKVKALEAEAAKKDRRDHPATRFSEIEINSYLSFELKSKFHPSLKSLQLSMGENSLDGTAEIDFDKLSASSTKTMTKMIARLFSGVHTLSVRGKLIAEGGKGNFVLGEAKFDDSTLPNILVSEIISAVGKKQKPPFDPLQPSEMPYAIQSVEVHKGYIIVHQ